MPTLRHGHICACPAGIVDRPLPVSFCWGSLVGREVNARVENQDHGFVDIEIGDVGIELDDRNIAGGHFRLGF